MGARPVRLCVSKAPERLARDDGARSEQGVWELDGYRFAQQTAVVPRSGHYCTVNDTSTDISPPSGPRNASENGTSAPISPRGNNNIR